MAGIFISHAAGDNGEADSVRRWLEGEGWGAGEVFLDTRDLKSGDRWRDVLDAMAAKDAVVVCLSDRWLSSHECVREFTQAQERGKPIFPIVIAPVTQKIPRFISDLQLVDLSDEGLAKLRTALRSRRIAPESFPWPPADEPNRPPYRGLRALDVEDAAIFFGRDAAIGRALSDIRRLRHDPKQRMMVIIGASGAGKSSFLRAGVVARLRREREDFIVLPILRPARAVLSGRQGLNAVCSQALGREVVISDEQDLLRLLAELRAPAKSTDVDQARASEPPTIILAIDQAEELFDAEDHESENFRRFLERAVEADGNLLIVTAIRSDSYHLLQSGLMPEQQMLFTLPAVSAGAFKEIIEGPAKLATPPISIEPALTQRLLDDLVTEDALPLMALTLESLFNRAQATSQLSLADYEQGLKGLSGTVMASIEQALGQRPSSAELADARRLFIPALVQVDQDGVKRRVARRDELTTEAAALAERFVQARILVSDHEAIEVAHEAILRLWPDCAKWIEDERRNLSALSNLQRSAANWAANGEHQEDLQHRRVRLREVRRLKTEHSYALFIASAEHVGEYLNACESLAGWSLLRTWGLWFAGLATPLILSGAIGISLMPANSPLGGWFVSALGLGALMVFLVCVAGFGLTTILVWRRSRSAVVFGALLAVVILPHWLLGVTPGALQQIAQAPSLQENGASVVLLLALLFLLSPLLLGASWNAVTLMLIRRRAPLLSDGGGSRVERWLPAAAFAAACALFFGEIADVSVRGSAGENERFRSQAGDILNDDGTPLVVESVRLRLHGGDLIWGLTTRSTDPEYFAIWRLDHRSEIARGESWQFGQSGPPLVQAGTTEVPYRTGAIIPEAAFALALVILAALASVVWRRRIWVSLLCGLGGFGAMAWTMFTLQTVHARYVLRRQGYGFDGDAVVYPTTQNLDGFVSPLPGWWLLLICLALAIAVIARQRVFDLSWLDRSAKAARRLVSGQSGTARRPG